MSELLNSGQVGLTTLKNLAEQRKFNPSWCGQSCSIYSCATSYQIFYRIPAKKWF